MQSVPKRVFTHEYRAEAVKLVLAEGLAVTQAARKLGLSVMERLKKPDAMDWRHEA
jgi:transposase-like protein